MRNLLFKLYILLMVSLILAINFILLFEYYNENKIGIDPTGMFTMLGAIDLITLPAILYVGYLNWTPEVEHYPLDKLNTAERRIYGQ